MLISDYLLSNIMHLFFDLTHFRELAEIQKHFGSNKNFKICLRDLLIFAFYQHFPDESRIA